MPNLHDTRFEDLRIFRTVARTGSLSAAASELGYVQSAVSRHIAALERNTGGPLFARLPRGVRLTPEGEALLGHVDQLLATMRSATTSLAAVRSGQLGHLALGSFATANAALVPAMLRRVRETRPDLVITFTEGTSARLLDGLRSGSLHLAVVSDYPAGIGDSDGVDVMPLADDPLLVALAASHPLARRRRLRLGDLAGEGWIVASGFGESHRLHEACAAAGFVPEVAHEVAEWTAKLGFVSAGLGITILPGLAATGVRPDVVLRSLGNDLPPRSVLVARAAGRPINAAADHVVDVLCHEAAALRNQVAALLRKPG